MDLLSIQEWITRLKARPTEYGFSDIDLSSGPPEPEGPAFDRELILCNPPPMPESVGTVEEAHRRLPDVMSAYIHSRDGFYGEMLLVKALPGTGKTQAAVKVAEQAAAEGHRVAYYGPRHDFFEQVIDKAEHPEMWYEWLPRQYADEEKGKVETCRYTDEIGQWAQKGYKSIEFCKMVCGDYMRECPYLRQKERTEPIIFTQHAHATLGHPFDFTLGIGDESPIDTFKRLWEIPQKDLLPKSLSKKNKIYNLLYALQSYSANISHLEGQELIDSLGGAEAVYEACSDITADSHAEGLAPQISASYQVSEVDYFFIPAFVELIRRECIAIKAGRPYVHRVILDAQRLQLYLRQEPNESLPARLIWLDATANEHLYQACFRRKTQVYNIQPPILGTIRQVVDRANGKRSLMIKGKAQKGFGDLEALIESVIKERGYKNPAILSFKDVLENSPALSQYKHSHFYAARGTNDFEYCDAMIVAGTPLPSIEEIVKTAKMIFYERDIEFKANHWSTREIPYQYVDSEGQGRAYPISGFWEDEDLQSLVQMSREDEIIQAAHRVRPVNHKVDIWLLTNLPISELPPAELLTARQVMNIPDGVAVYKFHEAQKIAEEVFDRKGFVTLNDFIIAGYSSHTARKYFDALVESNGWTTAKIKITGIDKPMKAIKKPE